MDGIFVFVRDPGAASTKPLRPDAIAALNAWLMAPDVRAIEPVKEDENAFVCRLHWQDDVQAIAKELESACSRFGVLRC
jgi:hypothetical protein